MVIVMGTVTISGTLRDANNNPVPNRTVSLRIEIYNANNQRVETRNINVQTNSAGNYSYTFSRTMYLGFYVDVFASFNGDITYRPTASYGSGDCLNSQCC